MDVDGQRFRVRTAQFSTQWLPDTPSNRHLTVVWFRLLVDDQGKPLFTLQELAMLVGSTNRQAASQHLEDFRQCGEDMRAFVLRKRKVDTTVVEGVLHELLQTPLAGPTELLARVRGAVGPAGAEGGEYRECVGADLVCTGAADAAAAARDGTGALSGGVVVDRAAGEPVHPSRPGQAGTGPALMAGCGSPIPPPWPRW